MKVDRPELRKEFNAALVCEWCDKRSPQGCDCCHLFTKGAGQVDVRCNLFAGHRLCHSQIEGQSIPQEDMTVRIAKREKTTPAAVVECVQFWRRLPKDSKPSSIIVAACDQLSPEGMRMVFADVDEMAAEGFWSE